MKVHRKELIAATEGRGFWIFEGLPVLQQLKAGVETENVLFKPVDAYRQGGSLPTFYYWLKDEPTAPVTVEITDAAGDVVFSGTGQPGSGVAQPPSPVPGGGRGGRGAGAGGVDPDAAGGDGPRRTRCSKARDSRAGGPRRTRRRRRRGRAARPAEDEGPKAANRAAAAGGDGAGAPPVSAHQGLNRTTWSARLPPLFTVPQGIVMWGGGGGAAAAARRPLPAPTRSR